ncbi:MAG: methionine adenosyltransferase [Patescibacteria group bacterium]
MSYAVGPKSVRKGQIFYYSQRPSWNEDYETIERKGLGHPDTIADTLAAKISQAYSRYTYNSFGLILHHQIDKLMIIGGKTTVTFGAGKFIEPIRILIAGRASYTFKDKSVPVENVVNSVILDHFREYFPLVRKENIKIENYLTDHAGSGTIQQSRGAVAHMFNPKNAQQVRGYEKLVANDTSYCIAYAPLSPLEKSVIAVEKYLNDKKTKEQYPWLGTDIKIMAVRNYNDVAVTACIPQIAKYVATFRAYQKNLEVVANVIDKKFKELIPEFDVELSLNTKDDYQKMNVYLTVSGASLSGDIGVVGRGNRTNGIITSNRPMSMEGANGKNPRYYSGFIYSVVTKRISNRIYNELHEPNVVEVVSQNGGFLKEPWRTRVVSTAKKDKIEKIIFEEFANIEDVTKNFLNGNIENF